jgi:DNA-binding SARP family transcriptional activator
MEFQVLGPLEVRRQEGQVALGPAKQRALLAILLVHANELVSSDRLIEELWPEPPETAANTLQVYVGRLRKALEPERPRGAPSDLLLTRAPGYTLRVEAGQLDTDRFERLLGEGRSARQASDPATAAARLREALALWHGPALADFAYDPFAQAEIARLEESIRPARTSATAAPSPAISACGGRRRSRSCSAATSSCWPAIRLPPSATCGPPSGRSGRSARGGSVNGRGRSAPGGLRAGALRRRL